MQQLYAIGVQEERLCPTQTRLSMAQISTGRFLIKEAIRLIGGEPNLTGYVSVWYKSIVVDDFVAPLSQTFWHIQSCSIPAFESQHLIHAILHNF